MAAPGSDPPALPIRCRIKTRRLVLAPNLPGLNQLFSQRRCPAILGGNDAKARGGRFSYWAADPIDLFEFRIGQTDPLGRLDRALSRYILASDQPRPLPPEMFCGGWMGSFSYDLGRYLEALPTTAHDDLQMPIIRLGFYDSLIAYDHHSRATWLIALELDDRVAECRAAFDKLSDCLDQATQIEYRTFDHANMEAIDVAGTHSNMSPATYFTRVQKIKEYIRDGETYQVNFSHRFDCPFRGEAIDLFHWQNQYNASPFAAYLAWPGFTVVSASPEMFLKRTGRLIQTRPVKGTRPRLDNDELANRAGIQDLLHSPKDLAELNMIIDLERNDLARICIPGTRHVAEPRSIEAYPTLFHAVATVSGQLPDDTRFRDLLQATFPGGSVTGAPKIRSMEIIDETEPTSRGLYTGSIGFIGVDGNTCLNIAIRTIIITRQTAFAQTGGGIVADSDALSEYQETITKARALLAGIAGVQTRNQDSPKALTAS